jgi:hypothetical protein
MRWKYVVVALLVGLIVLGVSGCLRNDLGNLHNF